MSAFVKYIITCLLSFSAQSFASEKIIIQDYIVGAPYQILKVNGEIAERAKHGAFTTVVPMVIVDEGEHILTIQSQTLDLNMDKGKITDLRINVVRGNVYRIISNDGQAKLKVISE